MIRKAVLKKNPFAYKPEFRQFNRKNNDAVAAMYEIYLNEKKSLQYIADVLYNHKFTRQSLYDEFRVRGYKLRSKDVQEPLIVDGMAFRPDPAGFLRARPIGRTVYLHHYIWEKYNGPIPPGYYVLYRDGDQRNNMIENLECIPAREAKSRYNHANDKGYKRFPDRGAFGREVNQK